MKRSSMGFRRASKPKPVKSRHVCIHDHGASLASVKADNCKTTNIVSTAKYTALSFLPVNLWEQFHRACESLSAMSADRADPC